MFYCEKCNYLMEDLRCTNCGKKKLREVKDNDFCYFVTLNALNANMFEGNLKEKDIPVAMLGVGYNTLTRTSSHFNVFVPYKHLNQAKEIYNLLFGN